MLLGLLKQPQTQRTLLSLALATSLSLGICLNGFANEPVSAPIQTITQPMLLRTVVLDVSGYPEAQGLDQKVQTSDTLVPFLQTSPTLLVHMEAIRRAYGVFGQNTDERDKFMKALKDSYLGDQGNAVKFFDYGYAQLVIQADKNGLFFLRKANDKLANPYTAMAYGIAEIDADQVFEHGAPDDLTSRKMDAIFKLQDALNENKIVNDPGIWASYVHVLAALKSYSAFDNLRGQDATAIFVPYGNASFDRKPANQLVAVADSNTIAPKVTADVPTNSTTTTISTTTISSSTSPTTASQTTVTTTTSPPALETPQEIATACTFPSPMLPSSSQLSISKTLDLRNNGKPDTLDFFTTKPGDPYQVEVLSPDKKIIGQFTSYTAPYIFEDLNNDGVFELVVRQYNKDPYHPLSVYRWNGQCYEQDKTVAAYFK